MASTVPDVEFAFPAPGERLEFRIDAARELDEELELFPMREFFSERGSFLTACSSTARFCSSSAWSGWRSTNSTRPSSGASERRRNPVLPARST